MARTDFGPEVKSAIDEAAGSDQKPPALRTRSPGAQVSREERPDVMRGRTADAGTQTRVPNPRVQADTGTPRAMAAPNAAVGTMIPNDLHHVAAAADIAHSILNARGAR